MLIEKGRGGLINGLCGGGGLIKGRGGLYNKRVWYGGL